MPSPAPPPTRARPGALRSVLGALVVLQSGASTTIGFQATHTGDSGRPASCTLNGAMCTVA